MSSIHSPWRVNKDEKINTHTIRGRNWKSDTNSIHFFSFYCIYAVLHLKEIKPNEYRLILFPLHVSASEACNVIPLSTYSQETLILD